MKIRYWREGLRLARRHGEAPRRDLNKHRRRKSSWRRTGRIPAMPYPPPRCRRYNSVVL